MYMLQKLANKIAPVLIKTFIPNRRFTLDSKEYTYYDHESAWATERAIEIPIILNEIDRSKRILELGNVLFQFTDISWDVIDKYESGNNVINEDIITFIPSKKYDLIVSVSTLEHIGFNENVGIGEPPTNCTDKNKTLDAINNIKNNCLSSGGRFIATFPIGYNKSLDKRITTLGFNKVFFMKRTSRFKWQQISHQQIINPEYNKPYPCANYLCIGVYNN